LRQQHEEERKKKEEDDAMAEVNRMADDERKEKEKEALKEEIERLKLQHEEERKARAKEVLSKAVQTYRSRANSLASNGSTIPSTGSIGVGPGPGDDSFNPSRHHRRGVASYLKTDAEANTSKALRIGQRLETFFRKAPFDLNVRAAIDYRKKDFEHEAGKALREQFRTRDEYVQKYGQPPPSVDISDKNGRLHVKIVGHGRDM
jgi:hypothetical protein